jgi:hypothetical protein
VRRFQQKGTVSLDPLTATLAQTIMKKQTWPQGEENVSQSCSLLGLLPFEKIETPVDLKEDQ